MKTAKYTPGPWSVMGGCIMAKTPDGYRQVGTVYQRNDWNSPINGDAEDVANARLKAAAPELLAALEHAIDFIATCQQHGCPAGPVAIPSDLHAAIAKATA
jgi:hypothetical protein